MFLRISICCGLILAASRADAAVIDVHPAAAVPGGLIRLADVADIADADPQLARQLEAVSLGPAPVSGKKLRLTQQTIRERLLAHGVNLTEIEFTGQAFTLIEHPSGPGPAREKEAHQPRPVAVRPLAANPALKRKVDDIVADAFHRQYQSLDTSVGRLKLKVEIPDEDLNDLLRADPASIRFVEEGLEWGGPQTLTARFPAAGDSTRIVRMQAWLNESPQILTVKHAVPKGQILRETDLALQPAKPGEAGLDRADALVGREATRNLSPGTPLRQNDLIKVPLVRANDLVTVHVRGAGIRVSRTLRATGNGSEGDIVTFVPLDNPVEKIQACVSGWHEAEIVGLPNEIAQHAAPAARPRRVPAEARLTSSGRR